MRIHRRHEEEEGLPLTPLIDVVFQLLIFFLTATSFTKKERDIKVDPPKATEGKAKSRNQRQIIINVRSEADGGFFVVNGRIVSLPDLEKMLADAAAENPRQVVSIRGDKHAYHEKIVSALNACKKAKIHEYNIATVHEKPEKP